MPGATAAAVTAAVINCWAAAAHRYDLPVDLLYAIGQVESSHNPLAIAHANNGTRSVGVMQINSSWFAQLEARGIREADLAKPCVNIQVGAWILRQEVERYGYSWEAIGAYYAGPYSEKTKHWKMPHYKEYAGKVFARWRKLHAKRQAQQTKAAAASSTPTTAVSREVAANP